MTPEEHAKKIRMELENFTQEQICGWIFYPELEAIIAKRILEALLLERDRIAKFLRDAEPFIGKEWANTLADKCWETEE